MSRRIKSFVLVTSSLVILTAGVFGITKNASANDIIYNDASDLPTIEINFDVLDKFITSAPNLSTHSTAPVVPWQKGPEGKAVSKKTTQKSQKATATKKAEKRVAAITEEQSEDAAPKKPTKKELRAAKEAEKAQKAAELKAAKEAQKAEAAAKRAAEKAEKEQKLAEEKLAQKMRESAPPPPPPPAPVPVPEAAPEMPALPPIAPDPHPVPDAKKPIAHPAPKTAAIEPPPAPPTPPAATIVNTPPPLPVIKPEPVIAAPQNTAEDIEVQKALAPITELKPTAPMPPAVALPEIPVSAAVDMKRMPPAPTPESEFAAALETSAPAAPEPELLAPSKTAAESSLPPISALTGSKQETFTAPVMDATPVPPSEALPSPQALMDKLQPTPPAAPVELKTIETPSEAKKPDATLPPPKADAPAQKPALTIVFLSTETSVPLSIKPELDKIVKRLKDGTERVTLTAYASGANDQTTTARRVSLSRALSVRAYLIDQGVSNLRINVQAEGNKNPGGEPDRVDVVVNAGK